MPRPTLVMIHGLVGSLRYFEPEKRLRNARVVTPDLLGYGQYQDAAPDSLTLHGQVDHVIQCIEESGAQSVWLLGHSMGGAIAMMVAARIPERIAGVINVEGNFTLKDAFWSRRIVEGGPDAWDAEFKRMQSDIPGWLRRCGVEPTKQRITWTQEILDHQPPGTVFGMSQAILEETGDSEYLEIVRGSLDRGLRIHLLAGQRSAAAWDVPASVRRAAASDIIQHGVGHMMMLEAPDEFCRHIEEMLT
ncbi:MAG: alpha/beta hydrolase [Phycisphaerales bacterium]|nr:MAG: alpha/beta hydrolase [Phycisphaerales bacterium]